jgi:hypothetical protein
MTGVLIEGNSDIDLHAHRGRTHEDIGKRQLSLSQQDRTQNEINTLILDF